MQVPNIITSIHLLETWLPGLVLRRDVISNKVKKKMDILQSQMTSFHAHSQTDEACYASDDFSSVATLERLYNEPDEYREGWEKLKRWRMS